MFEFRVFWAVKPLWLANRNFSLFFFGPLQFIFS